jgi:hypothetical protein
MEGFEQGLLERLEEIRKNISKDSNLIPWGTMARKLFRLLSAYPGYNSVSHLQGIKHLHAHF